MSLAERFLRFFSPSCASCGRRLNNFMDDEEGLEKFGMEEWLGFQNNPNMIIIVFVCRSRSCGLRCSDCWYKAKKCPRCGSFGFTKGLAWPDEVVSPK